MLGEFLSMLRPLVSIVLIRVFGLKSYKHFAVSLAIDLSIFLYFQKNIKVNTEEEKAELRKRKKDAIMRYIFKKPFFMLLKQFLLCPLLEKTMKP